MTMTTAEPLESNPDNGYSHQNWVDKKLGEEHSIRVTNSSVPIPEGLDVVPNFLSEAEATGILKELDDNKWLWGGFTQKLRFQKYSSDSLPPSLALLVDRLEGTTMCGRPQHAVIEEYPSTVGHAPVETNRVVTTFESRTPCEEGSSYCDCCFVAQVALLSPAVQHLNCPEERDAECWNMTSPDHWTDIKMEPQTLFIKSGEALWDWRSRVTPPLGAPDSDRVVLVKFYNLPHQTATSVSAPATDSETDPCIESVHDESRASLPMPPLEDVLTIIVTTSPIRSNPSTELLEHTFQSFPYAGDDFAYKCRKLIVCDGCRVLDSNSNGNEKKVSRRHNNVKQALRSGITTTRQAQQYEEFKENLKTLCEGAPPVSPFWNSSVVALQERHGYGFALREALRNHVSTPYVCVIQHDRTFMRPTPLRDSVHAMWNHSNVKYVGMSMRSNLMYSDIFRSKYGKEASNAMKELILRPPELALDASVFGPDGSSCKELNCLSQNVVKSTAILFGTYTKSAQCLEQQEFARLNPPPTGKHQLSLTPTLFWYDNTHICETAHYRDFVFDPKYQMVARGGFVEDKLSPNIAKSVERLGLAEGHARFGCYLLDDHSGTFFTGHLDGGNYLTEEEREQFANNKK